MLKDEIATIIRHRKFMPERMALEIADAILALTLSGTNCTIGDAEEKVGELIKGVTHGCYCLRHLGYCNYRRSPCSSGKSLCPLQKALATSSGKRLEVTK
jgi:hypothetical protein